MGTLPSPPEPHLDAKLVVLEALQKVDLEIHELMRGGDQHPKRIAELDEQVGKLKAVWDAEEKRVADNDHARRDLAQRIEDDKDKVRKWEARLAEQRTTREYSALAREIDISKKGQVTLAEELTLLEKGREELEEAAVAARMAYEAKMSTVGAEADALRARMAALDADVKGLQEKRAAAAATVEKPLLARYENIRRGKPNPLVVVTGGTCTGCRMKVPPQLYTQLCGSLPFDFCRSCNRIIYVAKSPKAGA